MAETSHDSQATSGQAELSPASLQRLLAKKKSVHEDIRVKEGEYPSGEHPLETAWTFWYERKMHARQSCEDYQKNLKPIGTFNTVEGFYRYYSHLRRAGQQPVDYNLAMFRKGSKPMWEAFPTGGCWILRVKKRSSHSLINALWESLVVACVGELFEMPEVMGVVLSARPREDMISVWNDSNENPHTRVRIGEKIREICNLDVNTLIQYKDNQSAMRDMSTYKNAKYYMIAATPTSMPMQPKSMPRGTDELQELPPALLEEPALGEEEDK
eukprot:GDKI01042306.1.p2 GENE.GDKI01042306.1~~GDKI01042306.1.p2  ORF type:complete len:270 (+),score=96.66 GDKI01042306.1:83-892(+)